VEVGCWVVVGGVGDVVVLVWQLAAGTEIIILTQLFIQEL